MADSVNDSIDKDSIMDKAKEGKTVDIYITPDDVRDLKQKKETLEFNTTTTQHTGSESKMNRSYRSVTVCLVLLCVLLLTAVIVLCVLINTNNQQFNIKTKNLTEERDQLLSDNTNITQEKDQLLTKYTNIKEERDWLLTKYTNITEERDKFIAKYYNISKQFNELWNVYGGWIYNQSSLYFISSEKKNWNESRRYCRERGADLIIINNKDEQEFVNISKEHTWIGLTDSEMEGTWKWVDGSISNSGFSSWDTSFFPQFPAEPNGGAAENCAVTYTPGWADFPCGSTFKWICEKNIFL